MALVAPTVCRFAVNAVYLGRPAVNVLDYVVVPSGVGGPARVAAIEQQASTILGAWTQSVMNNLAVAYEAQSVSWVDLDSASGSTGVVTTGLGETWPAPGELPGSPYAASVAGLVTKSGQSQRGQRTGKMFLAGMTESYVDGNSLTGAYVTDMNAGLATFLGVTSLDGAGSVTESFMCVVHTLNAGTPSDPDIVYNGETTVGTLTINPRVASQRRRNRG